MIYLLFITNQLFENFINIPKSFVLTGSADRSMNLYNMLNGRLVHTYNGHNSAITSVFIASNGRYAISGAQDNTAILWDLRCGYKLTTIDNHSFPIQQVKLSHDDTYAFLATDEGSIHKQLIKQGVDYVKTDQELALSFYGHLGPVYSIAVGHIQLLSGGMDGSTKLWNVNSGNLIRQFQCLEHTITAVTLSPCEKQGMIGGYEGRVYVVDLKTGKFLLYLNDHTSKVVSVNFDYSDPYMRKLQTADINGNILTYQFDESKKLNRQNIGRVITSMKMSKNGSLMLISTEESTAILFDEQIKKFGQFKGHQGKVFSVDGYRFPEQDTPMQEEVNCDTQTS